MAAERMAANRLELVPLDLMIPEIDDCAFREALRQHDAWWSIPVVVLTAKDLTLETISNLVAARVWPEHARPKEDSEA
jgi:CheY-like chemotaxis protein